MWTMPLSGSSRGFVCRPTPGAYSAALPRTGLINSPQRNVALENRETIIVRDAPITSGKMRPFLQAEELLSQHGALDGGKANLVRV